jgi:hypothetical protein
MSLQRIGVKYCVMLVALQVAWQLRTLSNISHFLLLLAVTLTARV